MSVEDREISLFDKLSFLDSLLSFYYNWKDWTLDELDEGPRNITAEDLKEEIDKRLEEDLGTTLDYNYSEWKVILESDQIFEHIEYLLHWTDFIKLVFSEEDLKELVYKIDSLPLFLDLFEKEERDGIKASERGSIRIVKFLIDKGVEPATKNTMIVKASKYGHLEVVKYLHEAGCDPTSDGNFSIRWASMNGHLEVVKYLYEEANCDPTTDDNYAIRWASHNGHLAVVKYLHKEAGCDPTVGDNYAIRMASSKGYLEVVKYLYEEAGCDPTALDNHAIQLASKNGHLEVVKYLDEEAGCDPRDNNNLAIRWASSHGHLEVVKYLYEEAGCDPTVDDNRAIKTASENGHLEVVKYLLQIADYNTNIISDFFHHVVPSGSLDIIKYLLEEYNCDPTVKNNLAIQMAAEYGHTNVVEYLMSYEGPFRDKIDLNVDNNAILKHFLKKGLDDMIIKLLEDDRMKIDLKSLEDILSETVYSWEGYKPALENNKLLKCVLKQLRE